MDKPVYVYTYMNNLNDHILMDMVDINMKSRNYKNRINYLSCFPKLIAYLIEN